MASFSVHRDFHFKIVDSCISVLLLLDPFQSVAHCYARNQSSNNTSVDSTVSGAYLDGLTEARTSAVVLVFNAGLLDKG